MTKTAQQQALKMNMRTEPFDVESNPETAVLLATGPHT
jgi:hypothetical protein